MTDSKPSRRRFLELSGTALVAGLAGCGAQESVTEDPATDTAATASGAKTSQSDSIYTTVYRNAVDSVVLVRTGQSQGTGFVFDENHVVTNAHVVGEATSANVRFSAGEWNPGTVVGTDPHSDLAVVAVDEIPPSATPLSFAKTDPTVGQEVVAIGNPYALAGSATTGIVSGIDRSIPAPTGYRIPDAIQTDAAVNPGNSGGPLMSLDGRVVAVINSGGGDNIAFGISSALAQRVVPEIVQTGSFSHSYVGVALVTVTPEIAEANDLEEPDGLLVVTVAPESPASGILRESETELIDGQRVPVGGDVLLNVDGARLRTNEDLGTYLSLNTRPGDTVAFEVHRDGSRQTVELEVGSRPDDHGL